MAHVERFDSVAEFMAKARKTVKDHHAASYKSDDWSLGLSWEEAYKKTEEGDPGMAERTAETIEAINLGLGPVERAAAIPSVAGYRVVVPDFLGGNPRSMRRRAPQEQIRQHVTIYVGIYASAGVPASLLMKRGSAILALLEALAMRRVGVDLYLLGEQGESRLHGDCYTVVRVENRPLDLSTAGFAVAHPAWARQVALDYSIEAYQTPRSGPWPRNYRQASYEEELRRVVEMPEGALYIKSAYLDDGAIWERPEKWVRERLVQFGLAS